VETIHTVLNYIYTFLISGVKNLILCCVGINNSDPIKVAKKNEMKIVYENEYLGRNVVVYGTELK